MTISRSLRADWLQMTMLYRFDPFELDAEKQELRANGQVVPLEPQVFALLELLVANPDRVIGKDELNERVWGGRVVTDAAVNSRIRSARAALGDDGKAQRFIRTVRERGFRFVAAVATVVNPTTRPLPAPETSPVEEASRASIAVMPLTLLSLDTRYEPLADAISHEVTADLSRLRWLRVISRASTFKLRGVDLEDVVRILDVDYLFSGSLAIFGEQASVTVELTATATRDVVWADRFTTPVDALITLRNDLVARIVNTIEMRIQSERAGVETIISTEDLDAWTCYFRGLRHAHRFNGHDNDVAMHLFQRAVSLDPGFALAHAGLSFTHFQDAFVGYAKKPDVARRLAQASAERAYELDPFDAVVNVTVGRAHYLHGHVSQAVPWFERAAALSPSNALAYYNQALACATTGEGQTIDRLISRALSLSPIDPLRYAFLATSALSWLANDNPGRAQEWSIKAANAPRAHHLIEAIAALAAHCNGDHAQAAFWAQSIRARAPHFRIADFYRSFPCREDLRERFTRSFAELGFT
ncbi:MAG: winged helix-turn-helix domain-containing protein [Pseudomonadales bacterium]|nr:winged helix-turn-helix domain-containing protein [Pseudomonadales bacterium]